MNEDELDLSWAESQIAGARVPVQVGDAVLSLLKTWGNIPFQSEALQDQALALFGQLARAEAVVDDGPSTWTPVQVGLMINVGDTVRVRKDAFKGEAGKTHNGRIGRVLAKRSGDIIVRTTDDKSPYLDGAHYPATALELKVS